ncbi:MAG: Holliday junction resolvase RuvX [Atopobiaceae bacterium]|nr:Holliday junction resolvase RuvX [Atopobiaceae bacterium]
MRVLALDIGEKRIGIAASDASGIMAMPVCVLPAQEVLLNARTWRRVVEDCEPERIVCGLPRTMAGEEGPQAEHIRAIATKIAETCDIPLEFVDERLSSVEAKRMLRAQGLNERRMRGKIDMVAASLFLQTWLDARQN